MGSHEREVWPRMSDLNDPPPPEPAPRSPTRRRRCSRGSRPTWLRTGARAVPPEVATRPGPRPRTLLVQVVVVVALAVVLAPSAAVGAVIAVVVLAGPIAASLWALRGTAGSSTS